MKNDILKSEKIVATACLISNVIFFVMHLIYIIAFLIAKAYVMVYINLGSTILYLLFFLIIKKGKYEIYTVIACLEIVVFMNIATVYCGYGAGFQLCFIGLCVLAYVAKYFLKEKTLIPPIIIVIFFAVDYIFLYFHCYNIKGPIELGDTLNISLFILHSVLVFIYVIGFMALLVNYVFILEKKILKESVTDKLTELGNRKALTDYLEKLKDNKSNYVLAIFDIDDFKEFNDKNGHLCGDYILKTIASIAKDNSTDDFIARWGGEEFIIIAKIDESLDNTYNKLDNIRINVEKHQFEFNDKKLHCTITMGIEGYNDGYTLDDWISKADKKLYEGKNSGKNKIIY